jgi:chromosome segregation ATPase
MLVFKKIIAATFMVLSVLAIVLLIVGLFGSWVVKAQLEASSIQFLLAAEGAITTTREGLGRVTDLLDTSSSFVEEVDSRIKQLGADLTENESIVTGILRTIGTDLEPTIRQAFDLVNQIEANLTAINDAVEAVRVIPMLNLDERIPEVTRLGEVLDGITRLREEVQALRQSIKDKRAELIDGKIGNLVTATSSLLGRIDSTRERIDEADARLAATAQAMATLRQRIPGLLTTATIVLNLIFLLSLIAFASLFVHAWAYFKCPQDGLRALLPGECERAPG